MKKSICLFIIFVLFILSFANCYAESTEKSTTILKLNEEYQNEFFPGSIELGSIYDSIKLDTYDNGKVVVYLFKNSKIEIEANLSVMDDLYTSEWGKLRLYDGFYYLNNKKEPISVILATTKGETFAIVNTGFAFEEKNPETFLFGDYSKSTKSIMEEYSKFITEEIGSQNNTENDAKSINSYNSTIIYSNSLSLYASGYNLGALHLYHNAQAEAGGKESVFGKVNSNIYGAQNYVQNVLNPTSSFNYVYPLRVNLNLKTTNYSAYTIYYESSSPDPVTNSYYSPISFSIGSPISIGIGVPDIIVSSVTRSYNTHQCDWSFYKASTFGNLDGGYSDSTGLMTRVSFYADGCATSNVTEYAMGTATIQYQYCVSSGGNVIISVFTVGSLSNWVMGSYTIVPN